MKKITLILFSLMTAFTTNPSDAQAQTLLPDQQPFHEIIMTMQQGWNTKNAQLFSSVFDKVHDYVVVNGIYLSGITPEANAQAHQQIFNTIYRNTDLTLKIDKVRFIRPDLALVHLLGATYEHGKPVPVNPMSVITLLAENKLDNWKIISFHNCNIEVSNEPDAPNKSPIPFQVMYASWYKQ